MWYEHNVMNSVCVIKSNCDLSVLAVSLMGFQKKNWIGGWVGGLSSIQFFWDFWNFFNFAKPLTAIRPFYEMSMPGEVKYHTHGINV